MKVNSEKRYVSCGHCGTNMQWGYYACTGCGATAVYKNGSAPIGDSLFLTGMVVAIIGKVLYFTFPELFVFEWLFKVCLNTGACGLLEIYRHEEFCNKVAITLSVIIFIKMFLWFRKPKYDYIVEFIR